MQKCNFLFSVKGRNKTNYICGIVVGEGGWEGQSSCISIAPPSFPSSQIEIRVCVGGWGGLRKRPPA